MTTVLIILTGVGRIRTQDVERRQGFTEPDHRSRRFLAAAGEESLQEEEAAAQGEEVSFLPSVNEVGVDGFAREEKPSRREMLFQLLAAREQTELRRALGRDAKDKRAIN